MGRYRFTIHAKAPPEQVFTLWTDLDRMHEWIGGLTGITDISGPVDRVGTRYTTWFGRMRSQTEVVAVDRPRLITTRFGNRILRGETTATFEHEGEGTRLTQEFRTQGVIPAIAARIFATGSYKGSFRGELDAFRKVAERPRTEEVGRTP
jgi:uncharacterized protein YndB with AHSA1/START domain